MFNVSCLLFHVAMAALFAHENRSVAEMQLVCDFTFMICAELLSSCLFGTVFVVTFRNKGAWPSFCVFLCIHSPPCLGVRIDK